MIIRYLVHQRMMVPGDDALTQKNRDPAGVGEQALLIFPDRPPAAEQIDLFGQTVRQGHGAHMVPGLPARNDLMGLVFLRARRRIWAAGILEGFMLWVIVAILVVLWLLGFLAFHIAGGLIHLLLIVAVVVVVYQIVTGRRKL